MTPIERRYSSQSCGSSTSSTPSVVVYRPKVYNSNEAGTASEGAAKRRSSADTVNSFISMLGMPSSVIREKRPSLNSLQEHREELIRKTAMLRKLSLADRKRGSSTVVSKQIRKFSLQVANGIQELFDENGKNLYL